MEIKEMSDAELADRFRKAAAACDIFISKMRQELDTEESTIQLALTKGPLGREIIDRWLEENK